MEVEMPEAAAVSLASRGRRSDGATETGDAARPPDMGFISPWKSRGLGRGTPSKLVSKGAY